MVEEAANNQIYQKSIELARNYGALNDKNFVGDNKPASTRILTSNDVQNINNNYQSKPLNDVCYSRNQNNLQPVQNFDNTTKKLCRSMSVADNQINNQNYQKTATGNYYLQSDQENRSKLINQQNTTYDPYNYNFSSTNFSGTNLYQGKYYKNETNHSFFTPQYGSGLGVSKILAVETVKTTNQNNTSRCKSTVDDDVLKVMSSLLSIFDSIDLIDIKNDSINSSGLSSNHGIFPYHVISSIFKITVGEKL
jgi:hypothetical protein